MPITLANLIFLGGVGHFCVLIASAIVPFRLNLHVALADLHRLHRQMHWVYGGYVVLSILAFGILSVTNADELARGTGLARGFCAYVAVFWGIRLALQAVFDVHDYLTNWWLRAGYRVLTVIFTSFTFIYGWAAAH